MPIRSGKEFLDALKDGRQIFIDGEQVADVTRDRRLAGAARSLAELYDMQHDPALKEKMATEVYSQLLPGYVRALRPRSCPGRAGPSSRCPRSIRSKGESGDRPRTR